MRTEPGTLALGRRGTLSITIAEETYPLTRDDIHTLLFYGQSVPLTRTDDTRTDTRTEDGTVCPGGAIFVTTVIDGHITVHASGRAVIVVTRAGYFSIPFASFQQVARGEAVSAPLFPTIPGAGGFV